MRNGAIHILDYTPGTRLSVYALALTRLGSGLKLFDIKCAWFNGAEYCEILPYTVLTSHPIRVAA